MDYNSNMEHSANTNSEYDFPVLRSDMLHIPPNQYCRLVVTFEGGDCAQRITPTITLPKKEGHMEGNGKKYPFMLSTCNNEANPICEIRVLSKTGDIDISYHYQARDYRGCVYWGSSKLLRRLGMQKEILSPTKNRYFCTDGQSDRFDNYIFTVEWIPVD